MPTLTAELLAQGADAFLPKPCRLDELATRVSDLLAPGPGSA